MDADLLIGMSPSSFYNTLFRASRGRFGHQFASPNNARMAGATSERTTNVSNSTAVTKNKDTKLRAGI